MELAWEHLRALLDAAGLNAAQHDIEALFSLWILNRRALQEAQACATAQKSSVVDTHSALADS